MSFVWGEANVAYLRKRFDALRDHPLFVGMEYSEDPLEIAKWAPLLIDGRKKGEQAGKNGKPDCNAHGGLLSRHLKGLRAIARFLGATGFP